MVWNLPRRKRERPRRPPSIVNFLADKPACLCATSQNKFIMNHALNIPKSGALDLVSLGALVHRLDPGIIPFRKASQCQIHVSGGEFNVAANLADCFRLQTGIASAMVDYPVGDLIAERVRAMGVKPFYKHFKHDGVHGPNMATVYRSEEHTSELQSPCNLV